MKSTIDKENMISISKIIVENLFGEFSYELPDKSKENTDFSKILILYGNNGSGKTTILQMLYHLLSPVDRKGHRSFLAHTRFKKFEVQFTNNLIITASRTDENLIGSYTFTLCENDVVIESVLLVSEKEGKDEYSIRSKGIEEKKLLNILEYLTQLKYDFYFISDDREFMSNRFEIHDDPNELDFIVRDIGFERKYFPRRRIPQDLRKFIVKQAISRAERYLISGINEALSKGELNVNMIYSKIIDSITNPTENVEKKEERIDLENKIKALSDRSIIFSEFDLTSPLNIENFLISLKNASEKEQHTIIEILKPYIEGIEAKLDALQDSYDLLKNFIHNLNDFYRNKQIEFNLNDGLNIYYKDQILNPNLLSSGEKQILMLFCNILLARERLSFFIIDEPEISLNVKWQRDFVSALLELTKNCQVQFILATHSIELISQYENNALLLRNLD